MRAWQISQRLIHDVDAFVYSSFGEGLDFLRSLKMDSLQSPSIDLKWNSDGGFSSRDSFVGFPRAVFSFMKQLSFEANHISRYNPNVIISDSRVSPIFAARAKNIPVVTLLNQFKVLFPSRFHGKILSNYYERIAGNMLGLFWSLSDRVLLPDLPPPYTISEANISGTNVSNMVRYVGFLSSKVQVRNQEIEKLKSVLGFDSRKVVFIQISGPNATKRKFVDCALAVAQKISDRFHVVISLGYPEGLYEPKRLSGGAWLYEWCPVKDALFALSDAVVARAGHGTIGQCINMGTPAILVPIFNHSEQLANAEKYEKLHLGLKINSELLTPERLEKSIDLCIEDPEFRERSRDVMEISDRYNGIDGVSDAVRTYL
jgi:UDP-N-acetylglucosamine--N-acetylmuramyl-(pentapeptide) pyrophosphoryl-undecaprenol N-acetylglucosamine transferase